jgi:capsular exopolysaccharide synthesis family protein
MKRAGQKVLLVTSVMENEGKSTIAANIALGIASSKDKVLLIDCDMRKPAQYKIFNVPKEKVKNFGDILRGKNINDDYYVKLAQSSLTGILNAEYQKGSTELIENGILADILEDAKQDFDFIIVDSSPMALVADAEAICKYADASMLVVKQDFVLTKDLNDTIDILNMQKASFIGCVLNGVRHGLVKSEYGHKHRTHHSDTLEEN